MIGRIKMLMAAKELSKYKMANLAGINAANFNKQIDGKQTITDRTLVKIADAVGANLDWLLTGEGSMLRERQSGEQSNNSSASGNGVAVSGNNNQVNGAVSSAEAALLKEKVALLECLVEEKERLLAEKERTIQILLKK